MQKRKTLIKSQDSDGYEMNDKNLKICLQNQKRFETPQLNDVLQLQYYGFFSIQNLDIFSKLNTLYLNNNQISKIEGLSSLKGLITLNLSNNRIKKIENLQELKFLVILDLSVNFIEKIEGLQALSKLQTLTLAHNSLKSPQNITSIQKNTSLISLNFSSNPLQSHPAVFQTLRQLPCLKILYMRETPFSRQTQNYRRQAVCALKELTFLDERPVTQNQRRLHQAWKEGGLVKEKQVKKQIIEDRDEKNRKLYEQMKERAQKVEGKRDELFEKLTQTERSQLGLLKEKLRGLKENLEDWKQIEKLTTEIEQLEMFLANFREDVNEMSVQSSPQIPTNLCYFQDEQAVYVYGVKEENLSKIKQEYFPDEERPIIVKDFQQKHESRWIPEYSDIFLEVKEALQHKAHLILPQFNLRVHKFDSLYQRKARRFGASELVSILGSTAGCALQTQKSTEIIPEKQDSLNQLD